MDFEALVVIVTLGGMVAVAPILALIALVRIHQLDKRTRAEKPQALAERLARLEQRVRELGERLPRQDTRPSGTAAAPPPTAAAPRSQPASPPPTTPTPPSAATSPPRPAIDFESIIAGRWLNRIGIVALLLAVAFFLKYAFDNDWIGPVGRVSIGLLCGSALLVYSQWLLGRGYAYFSEAIAATGAGSLYLSLYAAWGFYELVPQSVAFAGMIVVTLALAALAVGRDSQRLALLALAGGLMTPGVLGTGEDQRFVLFTYLAVLDGGLLVLARARAWRWLAPPALVGTVVYYATWYDAFYEPSKLPSALVYAIVLFAEFAVLPLLRARREQPLFPEQVAIVLANVAWLLVALHGMLYDDHRWGLTVTVLLLSAIHLVALRAVPRTAPTPAARVLYAGLALTLVTIAIPIRLEGEWITIAWAVEAAVLIGSGFRSSTAPLRAAGLALLVLVLMMLFTRPIEAPRVLLNARFATFAVATGAFATAAVLARRHADRLRQAERPAFGAAAVAINVLAVWALSMEVWDFFEHVDLGVDPRLARQMGLSVFWTLYATGLIVAGVRTKLPALRWQGLALLGLAVFKVFLFDLSFLSRAYRIVSFFALGLLLLVVSFLYQRKLFGERTTT